MVILVVDNNIINNNYFNSNIININTNWMLGYGHSHPLVLCYFGYLKLNDSVPFIVVVLLRLYCAARQVGLPAPVSHLHDPRCLTQAHRHTDDDDKDTDMNTDKDTETQTHTKTHR